MMHHWKQAISFVLFYVIANNSIAATVNNTSHLTGDIPPFAANELSFIKQYFFNNIMTEQRAFIKTNGAEVVHSIPGAVLASPSNKELGFSQDYQFHWVRDAALTMNEVIYLYEHANAEEKKTLSPYLYNYVNFENTAQHQLSRNGVPTLGQPKYDIDGKIWEGDWMRPQNDGPALRAIALMKIANIMMTENKKEWVKENILPMIAKDLNYLTVEWNATSYDLWEEVSDPQHFFTQMVQRKAMLMGAELFSQFNNPPTVKLFLNTAKKINESLKEHWNADRGYLSETVKQQYIKGGGLNSAIIMAVLYGNIHDANDVFALNSDIILSSVYFIRNAFSGLYLININNGNHPPMLGRYPNDIYDGDQFIYGNPWILTTNALAQYYYELANLYVTQKQIQITHRNMLFFKQMDTSLVNKEGVISLEKNKEQFTRVIHRLISEGDQLLQTVKQFSTCYADNSCYHLAEQIDRTSGKPMSAKDLTWGYASLLEAMQARAMLTQAMGSSA